MSILLKRVAVIFSILGFIGGIILGFTPDLFGSQSGLFGIIVTLYSWLGTFILVLPLFALSKILDNQESIMYQMNNNGSQTTTNIKPPVNTSNSKLNLSAISSDNNYSFWRCKKCGESNPKNMRICKSCGKDK